MTFRAGDTVRLKAEEHKNAAKLQLPTTNLVVESIRESAYSSRQCMFLKFVGQRYGCYDYRVERVDVQTAAQCCACGVHNDDVGIPLLAGRWVCGERCMSRLNVMAALLFTNDNLQKRVRYLESQYEELKELLKKQQEHSETFHESVATVIARHNHRNKR